LIVIAFRTVPPGGEGAILALLLLPRQYVKALHAPTPCAAPEKQTHQTATLGYGARSNDSY